MTKIKETNRRLDIIVVPKNLISFRKKDSWLEFFEICTVVPVYIPPSKCLHFQDTNNDGAGDLVLYQVAYVRLATYQESRLDMISFGKLIYKNRPVQKRD
jgi:hypothetical protein